MPDELYLKRFDMKILIINPNSSVEMSAAIQNVAEIYANGDFEVKTVPTPNAPEYIDYYIDQARSSRRTRRSTMRLSWHATVIPIWICSSRSPTSLLWVSARLP